MRSLVRTVDATIEPLGFEDVISVLKRNEDESRADVEAAIKAARVHVERWTGLSLLTQTWKLTLSEWPDGCGVDGRIITLDRGAPLASVTSVKYYPADGSAQATLATSAYIAHTAPRPGIIELKSSESWPDLYDRLDAVEITFVAGATEPSLIDHDVMQCVRWMTGHIFTHPEFVNIGNITTEIPSTFRNMLEPLRVGGWVA